MPQTSDELRRKWDDATATAFLLSRGWREGRDGLWLPPALLDEIADEEWEALQYLIEEWDHSYVPE